ncbi:MAG TPA: NAD-dependent epimerase/dehydratase family protein [Roseiflexaceae bacterium]|nr:NAD-dependent epimerase/dehydratase family protein [Roseiflexaceae bacterium]
MIALVTGGNGFIGRAIVEQLLARGDRVRVVGRSDYPELRALGVECLRADLSESEAAGPLRAGLRGCDVVFHVAAKAGIWGDWQDYYRNNVTATQRLVRAAVAAGVPKLVFTSSPSVVFGEESVEGADESRPYPRRYLAPYPHTKALAEQYVLRQTDILTTAIRPPLVWGPRDANIIPRILARARAGRLAQVGDGTNRVDVTYVENAAEAHLLAADALAERSPVRGRAYFIGQEQPVNLWDFVNELLVRYNLEPVRRRIPFPLAMALATALERGYRLAGSAQEPPLTRLLVAQFAHSRWFDLSAARRDLGYGPRISTEEGLRRTVAASQTA